MSENKTLHSSEEFFQAACEMARNAMYNLNIITYAFEREIYGQNDFTRSVQVLATRHKMAKVRILIHTPDWAGRSGHRLVELARRLTSSIELRELDIQDKQLTSEVMIADQKSLLFRQSPDTIQAMHLPDDPQQARQWLQRFDGLWAGGLPVQGLRRLSV